MNQIKSFLQKRGIEDIRPSEDILKELEVKIHTWNKWIEGKKDPSINQLEVIARWLNCNISDLIPESHERASV